MRSGSWASGIVRQTSASVTGLPSVTLDSIEVSRVLPSSLPGQARSIGGLSAATARATGTLAPAVTDRVPTPWTSRDWPRTGGRVTVNVSDGVNTHKVFTGKIDGSTGTFSDTGVTVDLVDDTDELSAPVSHQALFRTMPSRTTNGLDDRRLTGLVSTYVTNLAARTAGFYSTPPMGARCIVSAPLAGSSWPERGVLDSSGQYNAASNTWSSYHPGTGAGDYNIFMENLLAEWLPDEYNLPYSGPITADRPLSITIGATTTLPNSGYGEARWSGAGWTRQVQLAVSSSRNLYGRIISDSDYTNQNIVVTLRGDQAPGWRFATLTVSKITESTLEFEIETDTGVKASGRTNDGGTAIRKKMWEKARLYAPNGVYLNGFQVCFTPTPPARGFKRTFLTQPDTPLLTMDVMPALTSVPARKLLEEQSEADSAAVWIDEDGILRWLGHERMKNAGVVRTFTSSELADAKITVDSQDVRRKVTGKYLQWATKTTTSSRLIVYEGPKDEYERNDHGERIITPPSDEQWVQVDSTLEEIWGDIGSSFFNAGWGSFHGYTALKENGDEVPYAKSDGSTDWYFNRIGPEAWKWEFTVNKLPSNANRLKTAVPSDETSNIKPAYRGTGLPLMRAMGVANRVEVEYTPGISGPSWAPDLEVDFGWWAQRLSQVTTRVQRIAKELESERAMVSDLDVLHDPRLQLGDKIRIRESARTGLEIVGTVREKSEKIKYGEPVMTLELNVHSVTTGAGVTLNEFDQWYSGMTLSELDTKLQGQTLTELDTNPLQ